jgi:hypothetical protein
VTRQPTILDRLVPPAVREAVDAVNPVPAGRPDAPLDLRAREDLAHILATPRDLAPAAGPAAAGAPAARRAAGRRPGRLGLAVALATVVAVALSVAALGPDLGRDRPAGGAYAATPPVLAYTPAGQDAAAALRRIADRTATLPDTTGDGRYALVETRSWNLFTRVEGGERVTSAVVESRTSTWTADDGSGRVMDVYRVPGKGPHVEDDTRRAGELALMWPLRSLPADDAALARELERNHPVENGPAERLVAVADAYRQMPLAPDVRAAVLRYLATTPGLTLTGRVTDRAGREGIAVSVESDYSGLPTRYTLIFDPDDGRLLGTEDMLTTTAGKLGVRVPSVISYTVFLDGSRYTDSTRS